MAENVEKVVIIGSGPAGWTAAIYAARANLNPLVYEGALTPENNENGTLPLGQLNLTTEVENFPTWPHADSEAFKLFSKSALSPDYYSQVSHLYEGKTAHHGKRSATGPEMMQWSRQQAVNFGTRIITDDIVDVDFTKHPFILKASDGQIIHALSVIVATGARANYLPLDSVNHYKNHGVSACAVCEGALPRFKNKPLIVVGGGDSAVEEATYLTKYGSKVYIVHRRDQLRASKIMQQRALSHPKIEMKWNRNLAEVIGTDADGVTAAKLQSTTDSSIEELQVSGVFFGIGHTPNTAFLKGKVELESTGYIKLTQPHRTNTSVEGVFAAGDVADAYYRQAVTAAGSGCAAALDAERWLAEKGFE